MSEPTIEERVLKLLEEHMVSVFDCTRDQEAWHVGTMTQADFVPIQERLPKIAHDIAELLMKPAPESEDEAYSEAFEVWAKSQHLDIQHGAFVTYIDNKTFLAYKGWNARARLDAERK